MLDVVLLFVTIGTPAIMYNRLAGPMNRRSWKIWIKEQMKRPPIILIAAMAKNRVIGSNNRMPWKVPEEYRQFLEFIRGQSVIIGRTSFEIFTHDLTSARTFVLSRKKVSYDNAIVVSSLEQALEKAAAYPEDIYIAGGAEVYKQAMPLADKIYLSIIKGEFEGDTFFPEIDPGSWKIEKREEREKFEFLVWGRI